MSFFLKKVILKTSFENTKIKWPRGKYNQFWEYRIAYRNTGLQDYMNTKIIRIICIFEKNKFYFGSFILQFKLSNIILQIFGKSHFVTFILQSQTSRKIILSIPQVRLDPFWPILFHSDMFRYVQILSNPFKSVQIHSDQSRSIQIRSVQYWSVLSVLILCDSFWSFMIHFDPLWSILIL